MKQEAINYLKNLFTKIGETFNNTNTDNLVNIFYITLTKEAGYTDNEISKGNAFSEICSYILENRFRLSISDEFYEARDLVFKDVNDFFNMNLKDSRNNTGSLYNQFNSNIDNRKIIAYEVIFKLMMEGMSLKDIIETDTRNYISNYVSLKRMKEASVSKKVTKKCEIENRIYHIEPQETVKRILITSAVILGLAWIGSTISKEMDDKQNIEDTKPKYEQTIKRIPSHQELIDNALVIEYSMENNNPSLGGK